MNNKQKIIVSILAISLVFAGVVVSNVNHAKAIGEKVDMIAIVYQDMPDMRVQNQTTHNLTGLVPVMFINITGAATMNGYNIPFDIKLIKNENARQKEIARQIKVFANQKGYNITEVSIPIRNVVIPPN